MSDSQQSDRNMEVAIAGCGLVGLLNAINFARVSSCTVNVYENHDDPRTENGSKQRSINLTMCRRGEDALAAVDLLDLVRSNSIEAFGRVVWSGDGEKLGESMYGEKGESIKSLQRTELVVLLLKVAESYENVKVHFNHKLSQCDFEAGSATISYFENGEKKEKVVYADLFIGADGAHSAMREEMQKHNKMDFVDFKYHDHYYVELNVPSKNGVSQLKTNRIHVWPKDSYLLVYLPNIDHSYTGILVLPKPLFDQMLESDDSLIAFFKKEFQQVLNMVGEEHLIQQFQPGKPEGRQPSRLASLKCQPYHASSPDGAKFVLMGDAAHAMVPFYGMGMNIGFEDVRKFHELIREHGYTKEGINRALEEFSEDRCKDGQAMTTFSHEHYEALCSKVKETQYTNRRDIDSALHNVFGDRWIPEYTLVVFSDIPHSRCREIIDAQNKIVDDLTKSIEDDAVLNQI